MAVESSVDRQSPRVVLITVRAMEEDRLFESLGEVVSRVDFAWCIGQKLKLTTRCHILQDRGLTSSVIGSVGRHCVECEYGFGVCKVAVTLLRRRNAAFCRKRTQVWLYTIKAMRQ